MSKWRFYDSISIELLLLMLFIIPFLLFMILSYNVAMVRIRCTIEMLSRYLMWWTRVRNSFLSSAIAIWTSFGTMCAVTTSPLYFSAYFGKIYIARITWFRTNWSYFFLCPTWQTFSIPLPIAISFKSCFTPYTCALDKSSSGLQCWSSTNIFLHYKPDSKPPYKKDTL